MTSQHLTISAEIGESGEGNPVSPRSRRAPWLACVRRSHVTVALNQFASWALLVVLSCAGGAAHAQSAGAPSTESDKPPQAEQRELESDFVSAASTEDLGSSPEQGSEPAPPTPEADVVDSNESASAEPSPAPEAEPEETFDFVPAAEFEGQAVEREEAREQDTSPRDQGCPKNWGCWELIHSTRGTVLGVRTSATVMHYGAREVLETSFLTTYTTEYFGTQDSLSLHLSAFGSVGAGTAGNEGSFGGDLDVGFRGKFTETSGPFLRGGASGMVVGNSQFFFSMVEPLRARGGYQIMDGDNILEIGATQGFVPTGLYEPEEGFRKISRATELGSYLAVQRPQYRINLSYVRLFAEATAIGSPLDIGKAAYCDYRRTLSICTDVLWVRGDVAAGLRYVKANTLYFGLTFGLSP